ncbi:MAG: rRNA maturation RNase YbeY, partial [Candidatus Neomarinimicrobiota bacterium]|nr:rRNA maturation RNase YbeY [Candidatus Neomarinimicrobiota bacterium]
MKQIQIECDPLFDSPDIKYCRFLITNILKSHEVTNADVTIIFGSDTLISDLKKRYFQLNQWTDVISFRLNDYDQSNLEGEIYISLPMTRENAKKYNEPYERELARLIIH